MTANAETCSILAQIVHRKTCANSNICKIRAKDVEWARKMSGETKINLQNKEEICLMEPE